MTEGNIFMPVYCIIGSYIDFHRRKINFFVKPSIYVQNKYFRPKLLVYV